MDFFSSRMPKEDGFDANLNTLSSYNLMSRTQRMSHTDQIDNVLSDNGLRRVGAQVLLAHPRIKSIQFSLLFRLLCSSMQNKKSTF